MADIAFLLLIFFLVSTEIASERGIFVRLPAYEAEPIAWPLPPRNVLDVLVNGAGELLVEGERASVAELRARAKEFIADPAGRSDLPSSPRRADIPLVISEAEPVDFGATDPLPQPVRAPD